MTTQLMIDSGAYSAFTQKTTIDIGEYIEWVKRNEKHFEVYFNLDVLGDGSGSYTNWIYMRSCGLDPVPVFHITENERDIRFLKRYLKMTDYVAIGAIANMSTSKRMESLNRIWEEYLTDSKGIPIARVHGFGLTSITVMKTFPWWSVDSTSWVMFGRYGAILVPRTKNHEYIYNENPFIVTVSDKSPKQREAGKHFRTYPSNAREKILDYIHAMGFRFGLSKEGEVIVEGVSNVHYLRDQLNMLYYLGVQESMPKWPWAWKPTRIPKL